MPLLEPKRGILTDKSGTITLGGTSQLLSAANPLRTYFYFQNNSAGILALNFTAAASTTEPNSSIQVAANTAVNNTFIMDASNFVSTEAINVVGATTAQAFCCKEGYISP